MLVLALLLLCADGDLYLKNGKKIDYVGTYTINGPNIEFNRKNGSLYKLPVKIVDLDKTKKVAAEQAAKAKAEANMTEAQRAHAAQAKQEKSGEMAEFVEDANADNRHKPKVKVKKKW